MAVRVYKRFEVTKKDGTKIKLRIQDMREQDKDDLIQFMHTYFIHEEANFRNSGIAKSEAAKQEMIHITHMIFEEEKGWPLVCCVDDENPEILNIVGCNVFVISYRKEKPPPPVQTEECKALFRIVTAMEDFYNVGEKCNVDIYLNGAGLSVDPSYRGCGIATELLKARLPMIKLRGFPLTCAWFSSIGSQKAAEKAGYQFITEMTHEELGKRANVTYTDVPPTTKFMILKAN